MKKELVIAASVNTGVPVMFWGPPGVGKTATVEWTTRLLGGTLYVLVGSVLEPTDISGLPVIINGRTEFSEPELATFYASAVAESRLPVLFLDELTYARRGVQAALLTLVQSRRIGKFMMPSLRVIAAGNPPEDGGGELLPAMAGRFVHFEWQPDIDRLPELWLGGRDYRPAPLIPEWDQAAYEAKAAQTLSLVAAFLARRPELASGRPDPESVLPAAPCVRMWEMGARLAAGAAALTGDHPLALWDVWRGAVGEGAATELCAWAEDLDLPDPHALLAGTADLPERPDAQFVALRGACLAARGSLAEHWDRLWELLGQVEADVAIPAARFLRDVAREAGVLTELAPRVPQPLLDRLLGRG